MSLPLEDDPENDRSASPEQAMWCAALAFMLDEARGYWQGARTYGTTGYEGEQAFDDVLRVGPMTRHLCAMTGHDPAWLSEKFIKGLERKTSAAPCHCPDPDQNLNQVERRTMTKELLSKSEWDLKTYNEYLIAGIYRGHSNTIHYIRILLSDLPNDLIKLDDLEKIGIFCGID